MTPDIYPRYRSPDFEFPRKGNQRTFTYWKNNRGTHSRHSPSADSAVDNVGPATADGVEVDAAEVVVGVVSSVGWGTASVLQTTLQAIFLSKDNNAILMQIK